jgi:hypothetical protein
VAEAVLLAAAAITKANPLHTLRELPQAQHVRLMANAATRYAQVIVDYHTRVLWKQRTRPAQ